MTKLIVTDRKSNVEMVCESGTPSKIRDLVRELMQVYRDTLKYSVIRTGKNSFDLLPPTANKNSYSLHILDDIYGTQQAEGIN